MTQRPAPKNRRRLRRELLYLALPIASTTAAVVIARGYNGNWIAPGQPISASLLKTDLDEFHSRITLLELGATAEPDCPRGYTKAAAAGITLCKGDGGVHPVADEIVKVGTGIEAFWVDRYESSIWSKADGTGTQYGVVADDYPAGFSDNGQQAAGFVKVYAVSKAGVTPSTRLTWWQALEACQASGKRLPTSEEWLAAASGTPDPGLSNGAGGVCVTQGAYRITGTGTACASAWGAQDMIGNTWEWPADWNVTPGWVGGAGQQQAGAVTSWSPAGFNGDGLYNIAGSALGPGGNLAGHPTVVAHGADLAGTKAGRFVYNIWGLPGRSGAENGNRCVIQGG
jgi:hypothetical protein